MKRLLSTLTVGGAVALAGCNAAPAMNDPADLAAITAVRNSFAAGFNAGDADAIAKLYTADGVSMHNHAPTDNGLAAITASNKASFGAMTFHLEIMPDETTQVGTMAIDRGHYKMTITPKAPGAAPMNEEGRYAVLLKKGADGSWKAAWDIDNSSIPLPPPPPPPTMAPAKGKIK